MSTRFFEIKRVLTVFVFAALLLVFLAAGSTASAAGTVESESNNTPETANLINVGETVTANLYSQSDVDWFKFTVDKAGYFQVSVTHDIISTADSVWKIEFYHADGVTYIDNCVDWWGIFGNSNRTLSEIGIDPGTYCIKIYKSTNNSYNSANYNLTVNFTEADNWESEINNSLATADTILPNKAYCGNILSTSDVDFYKVTLEKGGKFSFDFSHEVISSTDEYWRIRIYEEDGVTFYANVDTYWSVKGNADKNSLDYGIAAGTYYIKVEKGSKHSYTPYSIKFNFEENDKWESEINNNQAKADEIALGTEYCGSILTSSDRDWYKVEIPEQGYMQIHFSHDIVATTNETWRIRVYQFDGVTYYDNCNTYISVPGNQDRSSCYMGVAPGTYYIAVEPSNTSSVTYRLKVDFTEADDWESELNNDYSTANGIEFAEMYNGAIYSGGDRDWYKFELSADSQVLVTFTHPTVDSTNYYWNVSLYEADAVTELAKLDVRGNEQSVQTEAVTLQAGTYYVRIKASSNHYAGAYSVVVTEQHDHTGEWVQTTAPTCTADGVRERTCTRCGFVETEAVAATGHTFDGGVETKPANAVESGEIVYTCTVCGETSLEETPSFWWVIPAVIAVAAVLIFGIMNYIKMIKRH